MSITKPKTFNPALLTFSEVKQNQHGGKSVYVNYNDAALVVQTPRMHLPYGMNEEPITDSTTGEQTGFKYSTNMSFRGMDREHDASMDTKGRANARRLREFHEMLEAIEKRVIDEGVKNSSTWLGQPKGTPDAVVKVLFNPIIRKSKDPQTGEPNGKYPDTVKAKVGYYGGKFTTEVYGTPPEAPLDVKENLVKGTVVGTLLKAMSVWFVNGKFGISFLVTQGQVSGPPPVQAGGGGGFALMEDSESEDEDSDDDDSDDE